MSVKTMGEGGRERVVGIVIIIMIITSLCFLELQDIKGGGSREKLGKILQQSIIFCNGNINSTKAGTS